MVLPFRIGSIPVRVHGSFFLVVLFLRMSSDLRVLLEWFAVVFAGVLLHELGHALVGRSFGLTPQIDLVGFGGLTSWSAGAGRALGAAKRIAISLAGPFTGIAIGAATLFARQRAGLPNSIWLFLGEPDGTAFDLVTRDVVFVNAGWGVLNLLPILPLDGGNVLFQLANRLTGGRGEKPARVVSIGVAATVALWALLNRQLWPALLSGIFTFQNIQALRAASALERDAPLREILKSGFEALDRGDHAAALQIGHDVLARASHQAIRADAVRLLAFGHLLSGAWPQLMTLMESPESKSIGDDELGKFEQAARELGRPAEAVRIGEIRAARRAAKTPKF